MSQGCSLATSPKSSCHTPSPVPRLENPRGLEAETLNSDTPLRLQLVPPSHGPFQQPRHGSAHPEACWTLQRTNTGAPGRDSPASELAMPPGEVAAGLRDESAGDGVREGPNPVEPQRVGGGRDQRAGKEGWKREGR